jgi:hypothetical protein
MILLSGNSWALPQLSDSQKRHYDMVCEKDVASLLTAELYGLVNNDVISNFKNNAYSFKQAPDGIVGVTALGAEVHTFRLITLEKEFGDQGGWVKGSVVEFAYIAQCIFTDVQKTEAKQRTSYIAIGGAFEVVDWPISEVSDGKTKVKRFASRISDFAESIYDTKERIVWDEWKSSDFCHYRGRLTGEKGERSINVSTLLLFDRGSPDSMVDPHLCKPERWFEGISKETLDKAFRWTPRTPYKLLN